MAPDKSEKHVTEFTYVNDDKVATQKDLKILSLELKMDFEQKLFNTKMELEQKLFSTKIELEQKINQVVYKLGALIVASSGILFASLSYFHKGI